MEVWVGVGVALVAIGWFLRQRLRAQPPRAALPVPTSEAPTKATPEAPATGGEPAPIGDTPLNLPRFRPLRANDLGTEQQQQLLAVHVAVPRPSRLLDQLLSPEFVNQASARQLADLVAGEPLLAARVLKAVNAPFYGLPQPVNSIAQAVTYLGLTTVRITCLRYIFIAAFKTSEAPRQQAIDRLWQASALASELVARAASAWPLADAGRWSSAVLLSFLGRLAVLASAPTEHLKALAEGNPVQRAQTEQERLGLCAAELGRLLLSHWGLPQGVVDDAADIGWLAFEAPPWPADGRTEGLTLCALCVGLSERAVAPASGGPVLPSLDLAADTSDDIAALRARLSPARWAALQAWWLTPAVQQLLANARRA